MPKRSGRRSDELEVLAASDGTSDNDAVYGMLSLKTRREVCSIEQQNST
jgi:hypothetical protein